LGKACPAESTIEPCGDIPPCPIDCQISNWGEWSACEVSCGGGRQHQQQRVLAKPKFGGKACPHPLMMYPYTQSRKCGEAACPVDCAMSPWSPWSECSQPCSKSIDPRKVTVGHQSTARRVLQPVKLGGKACPLLRHRSQGCNAMPCPVDCITGDWTSWGACSVSCGTSGGEPGFRHRWRKVLKKPQWGGKGCGDLSVSQSCVGIRRDSDAGRTGKIGVLGTWGEQKDGSVESGSGQFLYQKECPVDCSLSDWHACTPCSLSCASTRFHEKKEVAGSGGEQICKQKVLSAPLYGGKPCPKNKSVGDVLFKSRTCIPALPPCPVACAVGDWEAWSACEQSCRTDGDGLAVDGAVVPPSQLRTRVRLVTTPPLHGGSACPKTEERGDCESSMPICPIDCVLSEWLSCSVCDRSCGAGIQSCVRKVIVPALYGGAACAALQATRVCGASDPCPRDCRPGDWSEWSNCGGATCGIEALQHRTRVVATPATFDGAGCGALKMVRKCSADGLRCPVDCEMSPWGVAPWGECSECSKSCGGGVQYCTRKVVLPAEAGGKGCGQEARMLPCHASLQALNGTTPKERRERFEPIPCPEDCVVGDWGGYIPPGDGACSASCGGGEQARVRQVLHKAKHGGSKCPMLTEARECNTQPCPHKCEVTAWTKWYPCSLSCGGGVQVRLRSVEQAALGAGMPPCPALSEQRSCNTMVSAWFPVPYSLGTILIYHLMGRFVLHCPGVLCGLCRHSLVQVVHLLEDLQRREDDAESGSGGDTDWTGQALPSCGRSQALSHTAVSSGDE
jgi:hypothetical protein